MGLRFTDEFRSLYQTFDGTNDSPALDPEFHFGSVPIHRLPAFIESVRESFRDEHPAEARLFHPFFDGSEPGAPHFLGFMATDDGGLDPELFLFWRGGDDGKKVFLLPYDDSIETFLVGDDG